MRTCAFVGRGIHEKFHRQDFFFVNFACRGGYRALSARCDQEVAVREGDCYIGQPYSGYALRGSSEGDIVVGVLVRRDTFFRDFLGALSAAPAMLHFFLEPQVNRLSDEFVHMTLPKDSLVSEQMTTYVEQHHEAVPFADVDARFGYHPNYVSALLRQQTGQTFSQLLLQTRMERACLLPHHQSVHGTRRGDGRLS